MDRILSGSADLSKPVELWTHKPEPVVVVPVAGRVVIAVRRPAVPRIVVPTPAPKNPVRAFSGQNPASLYHVSTKNGRVCCSDKSDQGFNMLYQLFFSPTTPRIFFFVFSEFFYKSLPAFRRQAYIIRINPEPQKRDSETASVQLNITFQLQRKFLLKKIFNLLKFCFQTRFLMGKHNKIIHITDIADNPALFLYPMVKISQIKISRMLVPIGMPLPG